MPTTSRSSSPIPAGKDFTFKLGDNLVVNRAGKESKSDLKSGDAINVCYDKGIFTWTAHYILVQEGTAKNSELICGNVKSYDAAKKMLSFTNEDKKDSTYPMGNAMVRLNMADAKIDERQDRRPCPAHRGHRRQAKRLCRA